MTYQIGVESRRRLSYLCDLNDSQTFSGNQRALVGTKSRISLIVTST